MRRKAKLKPGQIRTPSEIIKSCDVSGVNPITWSWDSFRSSHHTRIPFTSEAERARIEQIATLSRRTLLDISLYFVYKTFQEEDIRLLIRRPFLSHPTRSRKFTCSIWISHALFSKLRDIAFKLGVINTVSKASSAPSAAKLIGFCIHHQLSAHPADYWVPFFSDGKDLLERLTYELKKYFQDAVDPTWNS